MRMPGSSEIKIKKPGLNLASIQHPGASQILLMKGHFERLSYYDCTAIF